MKKTHASTALLCFFAVCATWASAAADASKPAPDRAPAAAGQRGQGQPYELANTEVFDVADPVSGRRYQVFVGLPRSYHQEVGRRYPVLYVTDADYAFPVIRQLARRLNGDGPKLQDFILVGLSYAAGEDAMGSRRRDYTPTAAGAHDAPAGSAHGGSAQYRAYLQSAVFPFMAARYRTNESRRLFLGHSYGGLLGLDILFNAPEMFAGYIVGSPSIWYDQHVIEQAEKRHAKARRDLPAAVFMYVGAYEDMKPGDPRYAKRYNMVSDARRMKQALQSRAYPSLRLELAVLNDEDHLSVAPRGFTQGLKFLLAEPAEQPARGGR
jgi:predicted alpha/beta superfamily hydrolase